MKFRFASFILALYSLIGIGVVVLSGHEVKETLFYTLIYIVIPLYGAYGVWKKQLQSVIVSLLFFISQGIRPLGGASWFPFAPPFSLGLPFGNFSNGQGYLFDYFATAMAIFLTLLLWLLITPDKRIKRNK